MKKRIIKTKRMTALVLGTVMTITCIPYSAKAYNTVSNMQEDVSKYIIECASDSTYEKVLDIIQSDEKTGQIELDENNIIITDSISSSEMKKIKRMEVIVEEDVLLTGSGEETDKTMESDKVTVLDDVEEWNLKAIGVVECSEDEIVLEADSDVALPKIDRVKVAIIDSGVDYSKNINVVERKNFMDDEVSVFWEDNTGHGTAVAGIIASKGEENVAAGVNSNLDIYSARVLDKNNQAPLSRVIKAIYWAIDQKVNIINMSFGTCRDSAILHNAIKDAYNAGILIFAASGNQGERQIADGEIDESYVEYPAAYEEVVAVGAANPSGEISEMTSRGEELEFLAPGENIDSVGWLDMGVTCSGTSMAVPHAAGAASLLWQKDLNKPASFIKGLLEASAKTVIDEEDGHEYLYIDVEYAHKIYNEYYEKYKNIDNKNNEKLEKINKEYLNEEPVANYSTMIRGSWKTAEHVDMADWAATGELNQTEREILKWGAEYPDIVSGMSRMTVNVEWHGYYGKSNYFACYIYLTQLALCSGDYSQIANYFPQYQGHLNNICSKVNTTGVSGLTWNQVLGGWDYSKQNSSTKKRMRKVFIYGLAMHVATDVYAHSAFSYGEYLTHDTGKADNPNYAVSRWSAAYGTAIDIVKCLKNNSVGSLSEFTNQYSCFDGSFTLGNVIYYAEQVGIQNDPSYRTRLNRVWSGNYYDPV